MRKSVAYAMRLLKSKKEEMAKEQQERLEREQAEARARMMVFENAASNMQRIFRGLVRGFCLPLLFLLCFVFSWLLFFYFFL